MTREALIYSRDRAGVFALAGQGARSVVGSLPISDEQRRTGVRKGLALSGFRPQGRICGVARLGHRSNYGAAPGRLAPTPLWTETRSAGIDQSFPSAKPAVLLMGPTASGKTDLAVELVARFPFDIVSVDSAMVYRGMDIGTAKPGPDTLARAPHRLIDILDPSEAYSAARFRSDALREMRHICGTGRLPLLVGGTMLYFRALQRGLSPLPEADPGIRAQIVAEAERDGWDALHVRLSEIDPVSAARIHPRDPQRIQRALEVYRITGRTMTDHWQGPAPQPGPFRLVPLALAPAERSLLHRRIEHRFDQMLERGFVHEVAGLRARPELSASMPSMRAVGYRQVWEYLDGGVTAEDMRQRAIVATRRFARRQLTWLRGMPEARWLDSESRELRRTVVEALRDAGVVR